MGNEIKEVGGLNRTRCQKQAEVPKVMLDSLVQNNRKSATLVDSIVVHTTALRSDPN